MFIAILVLVAINGRAQKTEMTDEQKVRMEQQLSLYYDKLDLADEEKPKFEEITKKYGKQLIALKNSGKGRLSKYREFNRIQNNKNAEMEELLTKEQYLVYEEIQEEIQEEMKKRNKS